MIFVVTLDISFRYRFFDFLDVVRVVGCRIGVCDEFYC